MNNTKRRAISIDTTGPFAFAAARQEAEAAVGHHFSELADFFDATKIDALLPKHRDKGTPDLAGTPVLDSLDVLYRYGIQGELVPDSDPYLEISRTSLFVDSFFTPGHPDSDARQASLCDRIVQTAMARWQLDMVEPRALEIPNELGGSPREHLTIREIALLANMDEKSVRNAAYDKSGPRLPTIVENGRIHVPALDARAWLSERRNFRPTRLVAGTDPGAALPIAGFGSFQELGQFVAARRRELGLSTESLQARLGNNGIDLVLLADFERGTPTALAVTALASLGTVLNLDPAAFARAAIQPQIAALSTPDR